MECVISVEFDISLFNFQLTKLMRSLTVSILVKSVTEILTFDLLNLCEESLVLIWLTRIVVIILLIPT
jgi:hypothetical protein